MSYEIKRSIEYYISQGEGMLQQLKRAKMQQKNAQTELSKSLLAEGVGLITREIGISSRRENCEKVCKNVSGTVK